MAEQQTRTSRRRRTPPPPPLERGTEADRIRVRAACGAFVSRKLFYPMSGGDLEAPVSTFLPVIDEFWFVDTLYGREAFPFDAASLGLQFLSTERRTLQGTTIWSKQPYRATVWSDRYRVQGTEREITINLCAGRGYNVFRSVFRIPGEKMSVFFYRGDSMGEGGSGFYWLWRRTRPYVLLQLEEKGLLVSDGSNAGRPFSRFCRDSKVGRGAVALSGTHVVCGRRMKCVGYLGERYGPTLVWQADADE